MRMEHKVRRELLDALYPVWQPKTIAQQLEFSAEHFPEVIFLAYENATWTYGQVLEKCRSVAAMMHAAGVREGSHVAVQLYNSEAYIVLCFAISMLGATKVPLNPALQGETLHYVLTQSDTEFLLRREEEPSHPRDEAIPEGVRLIQVRKDGSFETPGEDVGFDVQHCCDTQDPFAASDIIYTSGSAGFSKGVLATHDGLLRNAFCLARTRAYELGRRVFLPTPFFHVMAYVNGLLATMMVGGTVIFSEERFQAQHALSLMRQYKANDMICMPVIVYKMLEECHPDPRDYPDMEAAYWTNCPDWMWQAGKEAFGLSFVTNAYGMTECGATLTMTDPEDSLSKLQKTNGRLMRGGATGVPEFGGEHMQLRICDSESGRELPFGETGEIQYRGPEATPGYYKRDDLNATAFTVDGWFRSRDAGSLSEDGYLTFIGRLDDTYKINGESVSPRQVEQVISRLEDVRNVEVVGIAKEKYGEVGVAFIDTGSTDADKHRRIIEQCKSSLMPFQVPAYFVFSPTQDWPKTASGKVKKAALREWARELVEKGQVLER